jgi:ubiquinone/menaquinone biosynthesis C-methylase UbiE
MISVIEKIANSISARSRKKKFDQFLRLVAPRPDETLVDVGVNTEEYSAADNYLEKFYSYPANITAVGIGDFSLFRERYPQAKSLEGDGRALPFGDNSFDIAYSNAVIEHVSSTADQLQFLTNWYGRQAWLPPHTQSPLSH